MDSKDPDPAHVERKPEQPDVEIDLDHLSQHHEEDRGAGLGHGLLGDGGWLWLPFKITYKTGKFPNLL